MRSIFIQAQAQVQLNFGVVNRLNFTTFLSFFACCFLIVR